MPKFLESVAKSMLESEIPLKDWVVILPSERAKYYLQKSLFERAGKAIFSPKILTINKWINSLSDKIVLDKTRLLLNLYEVHQNYPEDGEALDKSFDEFLNWGGMLLHDFDEIARYLVDSKLLFRNLKDVKEIENWSFNSEELSENQQKYLAFWERLPYYYEQLNEKLRAQHASLQGEIYRQISEDISLVFQQNKQAYFLFAGFNALSLAEMSIFKQLSRLGRAQIIFDSDTYYLDDKNHEAGQFIRRFQEYIGEKEIPVIKNTLATGTKKIDLISCSQLTGQVKVVSTILAEMNQEELDETLLLLADESLIIPLLQNIPKTVKTANISLGLPLKSTALVTWIDLIFAVQEGFQRYKRTSVYHKDLLNLWNHPFINEILDEEEQQILYKKEKYIRSKNMIFQSVKNIGVSEKMDEILQLFYTPWENSWKKALEIIRTLNQKLFQEFKTHEKNKLEKAIIQRFDEVIIDFQNCVLEGFPEMSLRSFKSLFHQEWATESVAYYGNPMEGLQIMGLLETRLLDFKKILVVGLNEGKMPPTNPIQTFIPMDLRRFFALPLARDKQGLFAHHFYRLLHHCEELTITYHNGADGLGFSEKSRYITQLELELSKVNPNIQVSKKDYTLLQEEISREKKSIPKTPELIKKLDQLFAERASISMLKTFFACPLDFYYKYVMKFGEEEKVEEELESDTFGTIIHSVLEDLYQEFDSETNGGQLKPVKEKDIEVMLENFKPKLFQAFKEHFNGDEEAFLKGKNFLSYSMSIHLMEQVLKSEKTFLKQKPGSLLYIRGLEKNLETELELEIFGQEKKIKLKGFVDRIDEVDGKIRIIDYKTGKVNEKEVGDTKAKTEDVLAYLIKSCKEKKHFFQLLTYLFLYYKNYKIIPNESAIISFVNFKNNPFIMKAGEISYAELITFYPEILQKILEEIYEPALSFEHQEKTPNYCVYC